MNSVHWNCVERLLSACRDDCIGPAADIYLTQKLPSGQPTFSSSFCSSVSLASSGLKCSAAHGNFAAHPASKAEGAPCSEVKEEQPEAATGDTSGRGHPSRSA